MPILHRNSSYHLYVFTFRIQQGFSTLTSSEVQDLRIRRQMPQLSDVIGTNFCDIGLAYNPVTNVLSVVSVIDNLMKGAAGQAVQNFNQLFGYDESLGLKFMPSL